MSRTQPTGMEQAQLHFPCDHCGADVTEWCVSKRGGYSPHLHGNRHWKALPIVLPILEEDDARMRDLYLEIRRLRAQLDSAGVA